MTIAEAVLDAAHSLFEITPLQPSLGAQVSGIDLTRPLGPDERDALRAALLAYRVLFFRDQDITREQHIAFGEQFGELEIHPLYAQQECPKIMPLIASETRKRRRGSYNGNWHADTTFRVTPSSASILRAVIVPPLGGDTLFANTVDAYEQLPDDVKQRIDGLTALHDTKIFIDAMPEDQHEAFLAANPPSVHPVVRVHPETGEKAIYVNNIFTRRILGISDAESEDLLRLLSDQIKRPEFQVRWSWQPHSIAFWDNRSTQHYAVSDYLEERHMERVTIKGDVPVGPLS